MTVRLLPENALAWELIQKHQAGLIRRTFTGRFSHWEMDYAAVDFIFRTYAIPREERPGLSEKITAWAEVAIEEEKKQYA